MITQKPISFKFDSVQLEKLSLTCQRVHMNRNQLLNFLVTYCNLFWCDYLSIANPRHQVFNKTGNMFL